MICPALRLDGSAGLAQALQAIDCRTGEATASAFARLFGSNGVLLPALTILLTLYVAIFAIGLLTGRARIGVSSLTPRMMTLGLVLTFATSWAAYSQVVWTLVTGAPDQIATVPAGTHGSATQAFARSLDRVFAAIAEAADAASRAPPPALQPGTLAAPAPAAATPGFFSPTNMLWLSGLMLLVGTVGVLVTAKIALAALLALGPVFIVLALFRGTRGLFEGWLKAVVLFALVPLFAVLIGGGTLAAIMPVVRAAVMDTGEAATRAVTALFLAACVYCALMAMVIKTASTIVAGWRLPGAGAPVDDRAGPGVATAAAAPAAMPAPVAAGAAAAAAGERARAIVAGLPVIANDTAAVAGGSAAARARRVTLVAPAAPILPGSAAATRRDGVGSRFRARPNTLSRDRLS